jgi:ergothioneine biosynthesis protein EgtB
MHPTSVTPGVSAAERARCGSAADVAAALQASRRDTLATFAVYEQALPGLQVPLRAELNPPLWELGHIGWFQEFWLARNPVRGDGAGADPERPRLAGLRADADALYHSSQVPHDSRWALPLPGADATRADLQAQLQGTLALLAQADDAGPRRDDALYFFRLALLHEDMHHEAALYMAQSLGVPVADARWQPPALPDPPPPLRLAAGRWRLGSDGAAGFGFDNEFDAHEVTLGAAALDAQVVRWAEFLPFVESGGHADERWWSEAGRRWRRDAGVVAPRYLRGGAGHPWQVWRGGSWQPLDLRQPACHLSFFEAEAWCAWAGRRLPTESEWERAALAGGGGFRWGDVWEWTASPFAPYPGFRPHPYRDYSAPWFDGRPVLRGASFMTQPRMRHPRYRNFFLPHRNDIAAGFRSCASRP